MITTIMFFYELAVIFIPLLILYFILRRQEKKKGFANPVIKLVKLLIFAFYIFLTLQVTGAGTLGEIRMFRKVGEFIFWNDVTLNLFDSEGAMTYILNIIMMMPFGFLVPMIWSKANFRITAISGFLFSLLIEISQLFNRRNTAVDDLLMNTIGAIVGYGIFYLFFRYFKRLRDRGKRNLLSRSIGVFFNEEIQLFKWEHMLYILIMVISRFLFYDGLGMVTLLSGIL